MPNLQVIVNTSPLLYLYQVGYLELLQRLYSQILTPPAVIEELVIGKSEPELMFPIFKRLNGFQLLLLNQSV